MEYLRMFQTEAAAAEWMVAKNRASRGAVDAAHAVIYVLVDGPEDDFAVMDLASAIDSGFCYRWSVA